MFNAFYDRGETGNIGPSGEKGKQGLQGFPGYPGVFYIHTCSFQQLIHFQLHQPLGDKGDKGLAGLTGPVGLKGERVSFMN